MNEHMKNSKEYRAFQIFEKLRDAAIEGLCRLDFQWILFSINRNILLNVDHYVFVWIQIRNVLKHYLHNYRQDLHRDLSMISKYWNFSDRDCVDYCCLFKKNIYSGNWMFNLVLFDAAPSKRRSPIRHGVDREKYESLL
jgi:hypothetical protein